MATLPEPPVLPAMPAAERESGPRAWITSSRARDVEAYRAAVAGVDIRAVRVGPGVGPNSVRVLRADQVTLTSCRIGFPILTRTTIPDDHLLIANITSAAPGSRWREMDLYGGLSLVYAPDVEHTATNKVGLEFTFTTATIDALRQRSEELSAPIRLPDRRSVHELRGLDTGAVAALQRALVEMPSGTAVPGSTLDDLLSAMVLDLSRADPLPSPRAHAGRIDSGRIVKDCIEFGSSVGRLPSIRELCLAGHVSERRLREAFVAIYDLPPSAFFRALMLTEAHRRLVMGTQPPVTVSSVAADLGFANFGRFASYYERTYGELPSVTLRESAPRYLPG